MTDQELDPQKAEKTRQVFIVSDGTAITAETLAHSILTQFPDLHYHQTRIPFVDTMEKAIDTARRINAVEKEDGLRPIIFTTFVEPEIMRSFNEMVSGHIIDLFRKFVGPLETELGMKSAHSIGQTHRIRDDEKYQRRIAAIDYTLAHDDGISLRNLDQAQVILLGVSRCGKTPTSLYLAMQFGIRAANYPFIADDMDNLVLPAALKPLQHKLFGLTINPERLAAIREERRENSRYASMRQCRMEVSEVEALYRKNQIPWLNSTNYSVEEIATKILDIMGLNRRMY